MLTRSFLCTRSPYAPKTTSALGPATVSAQRISLLLTDGSNCCMADAPCPAPHRTGTPLIYLLSAIDRLKLFLADAAIGTCPVVRQILEGSTGCDAVVRVAGGRVVAKGPPSRVARSNGETGRYLAESLNRTSG